eukprot:948923-Prymnesium_polylepis.1
MARTRDAPGHARCLLLLAVHNGEAGASPPPPPPSPPPPVPPPSPPRTSPVRWWLKCELVGSQTCGRLARGREGPRGSAGTRVVRVFGDADAASHQPRPDRAAAGGDARAAAPMLALGSFDSADVCDFGVSFARSSPTLTTFTYSSTYPTAV